MTGADVQTRLARLRSRIDALDGADVNRRAAEDVLQAIRFIRGKTGCDYDVACAVLAELITEDVAAMCRLRRARSVAIDHAAQCSSIAANSLYAASDARKLAVVRRAVGSGRFEMRAVPDLDHFDEADRHPWVCTSHELTTALGVLCDEMGLVMP